MTETRHQTGVPYLDLSTMVARVLLALLSAGTIVLLGLWLRASDALGFVATMLSVAAAQLIASTLRGERIGPPTAASTRLQPLVDVLAAYPGGSVVTRRGFKRGVVALQTGLVVAIGSSIVAAVLFSTVTLAPLWRSTLALGVILLPTNLWLAWTRSRQQYTGTRLAGELLDALYQVARPEGGTSSRAWRQVDLRVRVVILGASKTAATLVLRVLTQLMIPVIFSTPLSIAAVALAVVTGIAGAPVFAALARSLRVED